MSKLVGFLSNNPYLNLSLILIYGYLIIKLHNPLVQLSIVVMKFTGIDGYNTLISIITVVCLIFLSVYIWKSYRRNKENWQEKIIFSGLIMLFLILHYRFLLEMNIEIIHAFAYGIWFIPLLAFFRSPALALTVSLPFMLFDEWYQYQVLYPHYVQYWELNDVILNVLGCMFMMALIKWSDIKISVEWRWSITLLALYIVLFSFCVFFGVFAVTKQDVNSNSILIINKLLTFNQWWQIHPLTKKEYLVVGWKSFWMLISLLILLNNINFSLARNYFKK